MYGSQSQELDSRARIELMNGYRRAELKWSLVELLAVVYHEEQYVTRHLPAHILY